MKITERQRVEFVLKTLNEQGVVGFASLVQPEQEGFPLVRDDLDRAIEKARMARTNARITALATGGAR